MICGGNSWTSHDQIKVGHGIRSQLNYMRDIRQTSTTRINTACVWPSNLHWAKNTTRRGDEHKNRTPRIEIPGDDVGESNSW